MSNINNTIAELQEEIVRLDERKKAIQEIITSLQALGDSDVVGAGKTTAPTAKRVKRSKPAQAEPSVAKRISRAKPEVKSATKKAVTIKKVGKDALPSTGGDFWLNLLSDAPMTNEQVISAALATPQFKGVKLTPKMLEKVKGRWSNFSLQAGKDKVLKEGRGSASTFVLK